MIWFDIASMHRKPVIADNSMLSSSDWPQIFSASPSVDEIHGYFMSVVSSVTRFVTPLLRGLLPKIVSPGLSAVYCCEETFLMA